MAVLTKGSGYLSGETLTINLSSDENNHRHCNPYDGLAMSCLTLTVPATTGAVTGVTVNNPGNHYSVGDVVTLVGGGNDATLTIGALSAVPADTPIGLFAVEFLLACLKTRPNPVCQPILTCNSGF